MASLRNTWVSYITRSYQQIKSTVLTQMQSRVPEITDHTESNLFVKMISIWAAIAEMLGYYIDNGAREAYLSTCRFYRSAIKIARLLDYKVMLSSSARTTVTLSISGTYAAPIIIPQGTVVQTADGAMKFATVEQVQIDAGLSEVEVEVIQQEVVSGVVLATLTDGSANQEVVVGVDTIVHDSIQIVINTDTWESVDTFAFSEATDKHFRATVNEDKHIIVQFGDGVAGEIPASGYEITADYKVTLGAGGNELAVGDLTVIAGSYPLLVSVSNTIPANSGYGLESLNDLRRNIPISLRTQLRAVTRQDYKDLAELVVGVEKAGVYYNCGRSILLYIVPVNGGIASSSLCATVVSWFDNKAMLTHQVSCQSAGEVPIQWQITVYVLPHYSRDAVKQGVRDAIVEFMLPSNQEISGGLRVSDIYKIIEGVDGVNNSEITDIIMLPYAHRLSTTVTELDWERSVINTGATQTSWKLTMLSTVLFQLLKDDVFVGNFSVNTLVVQPEIEFKINGVYTAGESWEFTVYPNPYPNHGSIQLDEMSILTSVEADVIVSAVGGV